MGTTVVMGLGRSGRAAAQLALRRSHRVVGVDLSTDHQPIPGVELQLGPHRRETFLEADLIVVSPGIPLTQPDLVAAMQAGVPVVGELGFARSFLPDVPCCAITGTNGKSTVTWFAGQLLEAAGMKPFVGGNLGNALSEAALAAQSPELLVVEVSSYQLERAGDFRADVGVVLNLSPDHLARHGTMEGYAEAKCRLFANARPDDLCVLPVGDALLRSLAGSHGTRAWLGALPGVRRDGRHVEIDVPGVQASLDLDGFGVPGDHNLDNAATAALLALAMGADLEAVRQALPGLRPLEHRMEVVAEHDGVLWINDSKATNVDAARVGISGLDRAAVVLLGGQAKGSGFAALAPLLERHRAVVCFGESGPAIADELAQVGVLVHRVDTLEAAVERASELALPGDAVLLSPGGASFDAFHDFEHRGRVFRDLVQGRLP